MQISCTFHLTPYILFPFVNIAKNGASILSSINRLVKVVLCSGDLNKYLTSHANKSRSGFPWRIHFASSLPAPPPNIIPPLLNALPKKKPLKSGDSPNMGLRSGVKDSKKCFHFKKLHAAYTGGGKQRRRFHVKLHFLILWSKFY